MSPPTPKTPLLRVTRVESQARLGSEIRAQQRINRARRVGASGDYGVEPLPACVGYSRLFNARSGGGDRDYRLRVVVAEAARLISLGSTVTAFDDAVVIATRDTHVLAFDRVLVVAGEGTVVEKASPNVIVWELGNADVRVVNTPRPALVWE